MLVPQLVSDSDTGVLPLLLLYWVCSHELAHTAGLAVPPLVYTPQLVLSVPIRR